MIGSSYSDIVPEKLTNIVDKNEWPSRYEELQCNSSDFDLLKNLWNLTDEVKDQDLVPQKKWKRREEGRKVWWCGGGGGRNTRQRQTRRNVLHSIPRSKGGLVTIIFKVENCRKERFITMDALFN